MYHGNGSGCLNDWRSSSRILRPGGGREGILLLPTLLQPLPDRLAQDTGEKEDGNERKHDEQDHDVALHWRLGCSPVSTRFPSG